MVTQHGSQRTLQTNKKLKSSMRYNVDSAEWQNSLKLKFMATQVLLWQNINRLDQLLTHIAHGKILTLYCF